MTTHPEHLLVRAADGSGLDPAERRELDAHLEACAECRGALEDQRIVAELLRERGASDVHADFRARLAARLDGTGMLDLANWRAWTVGLAPVAAALVMAAYVGFGSTTSTTATETTTTSESVTFDTWAASSAGSTPAAVFLQPNASGDQLLETVLTGAVPASARESSDVR